jgi:hypothetical protein
MHKECILRMYLSIHQLEVRGRWDQLVQQLQGIRHIQRMGRIHGIREGNQTLLVQHIQACFE